LDPADQAAALERHALVAAAIAQKKSIRPFEHGIRELEHGYYVVFPKERESDKKILAFLNWLKVEIKSS